MKKLIVSLTILILSSNTIAAEWTEVTIGRNVRSFDIYQNIQADIIQSPVNPTKEYVADLLNEFEKYTKYSCKARIFQTAEQTNIYALKSCIKLN